MLGYVAQLATTSVEAITLMKLTGDSGIVELAHGGDIRRYPPYHLLACLQGCGSVRKVSVCDPARVAALAVTRGARHELLLANLSDAASVVEIRGMSAAAGISVMDARSWRDSAVTTNA